jgi:hypothetical protein
VSDPALGVLACLLALWAWVQARALDTRRRITGCTHGNTYVSQTRPQYGEALTFHCKDCGYQQPLRQLHREADGRYRYLQPGEGPYDNPRRTA